MDRIEFTRIVDQYYDESYGPLAHRYSKGRISKEVPGCARNGRDSAQRRYTPSVTHSSSHGRER